MVATRFEAGHVVRLNSGGPLMTVRFVRVTDETEAGLNSISMCYWFDTYGVPHSADFLSCMLDGPLTGTGEMLQ